MPVEIGLAALALLAAMAAGLAARNRRPAHDPRVERQLRESEARYRSLVENIPGIAYIDPIEGEPVAPLFISPQSERILGFTQEDWADPNLWVERLHPDDRARTIAESDRADETGETFLSEYRFIARDGRTVWIRDECVLVRDERGTPLFWQGFMFDITERKQAEEQAREAETRYRTLVEQIPSITYIDVADPDLTAGFSTVYCSPQIEQLLGYSVDEFMNDPELWPSILHPADREPSLAADARHFETGEPMAEEFRVVARDGRIVWLRNEAVAIRGEDGRIKYSQGIMLDITERKLVETALEESERREREAADRLRVLDDMKNTFLAAVSHELRSPLTTILGLALTLERGDVPPEDGADLLGRLASNARKLDRLLADLLDIDRLSRGIIEPQVHEVDVGALARVTVNSLDLPRGRTVGVEADPVVVSVDPAKVERIVENLVMNAVRHTEDATHVWVRVRAHDDGVLIAVEDDGRGVPPELWTDIFEPFRQGPTVSSHSPGTGIGLSLVSRFAALHGGRAWVEDREGGGASFRVFLPGARPDEPDAASGAGVSTGAAAL